MALEVLQRLTWSGTPLDQGDVFRLVKGDRRLVCRLFTHQFGWELRCEVNNGDMVRTQVCRTEQEVFDTFALWKTNLQGRGWQVEGLGS